MLSHRRSLGALGVVRVALQTLDERGEIGGHLSLEARYNEGGEGGVCVRGNVFTNATRSSRLPSDMEIVPPSQSENNSFFTSSKQH